MAGHRRPLTLELPDQPDWTPYDDLSERAAAARTGAPHGGASMFAC
jgi:hypothetical protein